MLRPGAGATINQLLVFWERFSAKRRLCVTPGGAQNYNPSTQGCARPWRTSLTLGFYVVALQAASTTYVNVDSVLQALNAKLYTLNKISVYSVCSVVTTTTQKTKNFVSFRVFSWF
jgi:hypothetical protein